MAMLGMLYALPNTALSRRLIKEHRLFKNSSILKDDHKMIDQTSTGLNFITYRPRLDILKDYLHIEQVIYDPVNYFKRVTSTAIQLQWKPKYKPGLIKGLKTGLTFIKLSRRLGENRSTTWPYFKMIFSVLFKNPAGLEPAVNLSAMFIHFHKQSQSIMQQIASEIVTIMDRQLEEKSDIAFKKHHVSKNLVIKETVR